MITDYEDANIEQAVFLCRLLTGNGPLGWVEEASPAILPIAGEIDTGSERQLLGQGRVRFKDLFGPFAPREIDTGFFDESEIPAVPYYRQSTPLSSEFLIAPKRSFWL